MEKPNLLWETIRYSPVILYTLDTVMKGLRSSLFNDMSHFHYFLESEFGCTNVRDSDFTYCKSLLISELFGPGLLFYHKQTGEDVRSFEYNFKSFDCNT